MFFVPESTGARDSLSLSRLQEVLDLKHNCGYLTFLKTGEKLAPLPPTTTTTTQSGKRLAKVGPDSLYDLL